MTASIMVLVGFGSGDASALSREKKHLTKVCKLRTVIHGLILYFPIYVAPQNW